MNPKSKSTNTTAADVESLVTEATLLARRTADSVQQFVDVVERLGTLAASTSRPLLLTVDEAADMLGVGRSTIYLMIKRGELPAVTLNKAMRIRRADIERYVEAMSRVDTSQAEAS